jgi:methyl-accepting chemotaxis protein
MMATQDGKADIKDRMDFIGLDKESLLALSKVQGEIERHLPDALAGFYQKLATVPAVTRFFAEAGQMQRAEASQLDHWRAIATGKFDDAYVEASRRIGLRHAKIGLEPRWYIGGYGVIVDGLIRGVIKSYLGAERRTRRGLFSKATHSDRSEVADGMADAVTAIIKCVLVDIDMAVTVYFDKMMADSQARDRESAAKIEHAAELTGEVLQQLAGGDLTSRITADLDGGFAKIKSDTNAMADRFSNVMEQLQAASTQLRTATGEILSGANDLSTRTVRQAAAIEQTAASVEQLTNTVRENANSAKQASGLADRAAATAEAGGQVMQQVKGAMGNITDAANKIGAIIGMIDDIAFQTNLLALNASVEAARAGDAGRSFAVVAGEVRRLAEMAGSSSRDVKTLVDAALVAVKSGDELVTQASDVLDQLGDVVRESNHQMGAISEASATQSISLQEILGAIRQMDEMTQHNAALVEETNAAIEQAEAQASELDGIVDQFTLKPVTGQRGELRLVS